MSKWFKRAVTSLAALLLLLGIIGGTGSGLLTAVTGSTLAIAEGAESTATTGGGQTIVMGTSPDYPPYENTDAKNGGKVVGLDIDIAQAIADKLGYKLEISGMDFSGLIAALQTERVDFVMSAMSVTEERKQSIDFSDSYYAARNTIVSKKDSGLTTMASLEGKNVGVQLGSTQEEAVAGMESTSKITKLDKIPNLIQEIKAGRMDAAIVEDAVAWGYTDANPDLQFTILDPNPNDLGYAIAFPKGSELTAQFNAELQKMKDNGELQAIIDKWFGALGQDDSKKVSKSGLDFSILDGYVGYIFKGIFVTLLFTFVSALFGFIWGAILSLFKISNIAPLRWFATAYTSVFRGTPLLLQLFLIYYATPQLFNYDIPALLAAGLAFGLNSAAYLSETIRGGIMAVDKGQREAAIALGIPYKTMMFSIILPQAVKNILPALVNECVALVKESSLVSVIGVADLMRRASVVQAATFRSFEALLLIGAIYYVLVLLLTSLAGLLERRMRRSD
ncbi:polar amino acid transport system substrate-binding protein [Paenibacillus phyllosphaerae]|uniref:Polar amino acid transport system substrate-binding protein n=1 Tax=Paenibacillus phyllosphaerae TaxID=274593 RepID=A0A7W5AXR3_9BACL|nr:ABC transporter substrate-binding protein/permease [Paenibacillus phyllosphaerae]MBB3110720.1 polar amino acid transport system substrate-binding protein [Paenibacillus phyllosphaerae]